MGNKISTKIKKGDKFNKLTAISFDSVKSKVYKTDKNKSGILTRHWNYWLFKCDCSKEKILNIDDVMYDHTKSCGCVLQEYQDTKSSYNKLAEGEGSFNYLFRSYIKGAAVRKRAFELSKEEFRYLTKQNCYYCGIPPLQETLNAGCNGKYLYNGIDRVDNNIDYTFDNCVACCKRCNMAKGIWSLDEFKIWLSNLINNNKHLLDERN